MPGRSILSDDAAREILLALLATAAASVGAMREAQDGMIVVCDGYEARASAAQVRAALDEWDASHP